VIGQTEQLSAIRLLMNRITTELRAAHPEPSFGQALVGTSNSIQFIKTEVPSFASWAGDALGRSTLPATDLKLVHYRLATQSDTNTGASSFDSGTNNQSLDLQSSSNIIGLLRLEEALVASRQSSISTDETDSALDQATNTTANATLLPVIPEIRFLHFRYWGGSNWLDTWNAQDMPQGIEVSLAAEPATNSTDSAELSAEIFRRVIYLPGSEVAQTNSSSTTTPPAQTTETNSTAEAVP
jgi:hypothetical protein